MFNFDVYKAPWGRPLTLLVGFGVLPATYAEECVTRDQVLASLEEGLTAQELEARFKPCLQANQTAAKETSKLSELVITDTGSTSFEAIKACGYHPQRKELTCPIEIRQRFGYGGPIAPQPAGSFEYLQFCVDYGLGLVPVNVNGVHIHDEVFGVEPKWYFTGVVSADDTLFSQPLNGTTLQARAILSWAFSPGGDCNFKPIFGNQADFPIRLDP